MYKHFHRLICAICVAMLTMLSLGAYAGADPDPAFGVITWVIDLAPTVAADDTTSDDTGTTDKIDYLVNSAGPLERYSAFSRHSKAVALPADADINAFRLSLKVPWQYWQA